jgi:outer membrane protein OmpA-like peptidoglycan-associated protein
MRIRLMVVAGAAALIACMSAIPRELFDARMMYERASEGPASQLASDEMAAAARALDRAEREYQLRPGSQEARDLAYVAQRRVLIAESKVRADQARQARDAALAQLSEQGRRTATELSEARTRLEIEQQRQAAAEEELQRRQQLLESEQRAREQAEQQASEALRELERFAEVREEKRGTVISLPGSLLFPPGETDLAPGAQRRLEEVADVLRQHPQVRLVIEGHSDSRGADDYNYELSYFRALAVKDDLVSRGIPADQVEAVGYGETRPIAPNTSAEGRAANRRVEIVVQRTPEEPGLGGAGQEEPEGGQEQE